MALQEEINEKKKEISTDGYPMSIGELISLYKEGELDIHPEFQRFFRWNEKQKSKLIESILLGIPIPSIFVSQRADGVWDVVDGLQRLSTIFEFVGILKDEKNEPVPASKLVKTAYLPSLEGKYWESESAVNSFDTSQRLVFKREKIDVKIVKKESDDTVKFELFQRLNTLGSKLSDQEVRNCLLVMLNKDFYSWLKQLSDDENFLNTISIADRLIDEKYNMELALRFLILSQIEPNEVRGLNDFSEFVTEKMIAIATSSDYDKVSWELKFRNTFSLLNNAMGEFAFKKYAVDKGRFEGKFLLAPFEAIAIGLGDNIEDWVAISYNDNLKDNLIGKIKSIWENPAFQARYGSGVNVTTRVPVIVPLGKAVLVP
jgi:hypothetical protein